MKTTSEKQRENSPIPGFGKGVVYTCLFGGSEELNFEAVEGSACDFVVFTDQDLAPPDNVSVIHVRASAIGAARQSRRAKVLPFEFFEGYDWSLYVDNTLSIKSPPEKLAREFLLSGEYSLFCFPHPWRDCIYDEAEVIIREQIDNEATVREQVDTYAREGYPRQLGLSALTAILRNHNDPSLRSHHIEWYEHILRFSKRDQLSFDYLRWRHKLEIGYFPFDLVENDHFEWKSLKRLPRGFDPEIFCWREGVIKTSEKEIAREYFAMNNPLDRNYRHHHWELNRLFNKYKSDKGTRYFNAHGYGYIYEFLLEGLKDKSINLLEVGLLRHDVQASLPNKCFDDAPSLLAWSEYLENGRIIGFDIQDFSGVSLPENASVFRGDSSNPDDIQRLVNLHGVKFDVVIDDGSHASHHQQIFLDNIFDHVAPGGFVFIEDLHYQPPTLEKKDAPKTLDVLKEMQRGEVLDSPYISRARQRSISGRCSKIEFWDSRESTFGKVHNNALCCLHVSS